MRISPGRSSGMGRSTSSNGASTSSSETIFGKIMAFMTIDFPFESACYDECRHSTAGEIEGLRIPRLATRTEVATPGQICRRWSFFYHASGVNATHRSRQSRPGMLAKIGDRRGGVTSAAGCLGLVLTEGTIQTASAGDRMPSASSRVGCHGAAIQAMFPWVGVAPAF